MGKLLKFKSLNENTYLSSEITACECGWEHPCFVITVHSENISSVEAVVKTSYESAIQYNCPVCDHPYQIKKKVEYTAATVSTEEKIVPVIPIRPLK